MAAPRSDDENCTENSNTSLVRSKDKTNEFLLRVAILSAVLGINVSLYSTTRGDPFVSKKMKYDEVTRHNATKEIFRALRLGTLLGVSAIGFSFYISAYISCRWFGVRDFYEFFAIIRHDFPEKESKGREDFKTHK